MICITKDVSTFINAYRYVTEFYLKKYAITVKINSN